MSDGSPLDRLLPPQVKHDSFSRTLMAVAATPGVKTILEIGASAGGGSTEALVNGALRNPDGPPQLHSIEVSVARIDAFRERWRDFAFVHPHHVSSVPRESFPSPEVVTRFYREERSKLRNVRLEKVLRWLQVDLDYLAEHPALSVHGIRRIKEAAGISLFDAVLIDGSEFTGRVEIEEVYGARFLMLDDTRSYKNWDNLRRLEKDPAYCRVKKSHWTRNGWAVFERREA